MFNAVLLMLYGVVSAAILPSESMVRLPMPEEILAITAPEARCGRRVCSTFAGPMTLVEKCEISVSAVRFRLVSCRECRIAALLMRTSILNPGPSSETSWGTRLESDVSDDMSHSEMWTEALLLNTIALRAVMSAFKSRTKATTVFEGSFPS